MAIFFGYMEQPNDVIHSELNENATKNGQIHSNKSFLTLNSPNQTRWKILFHSSNLHVFKQII